MKPRALMAAKEGGNPFIGLAVLKRGRASGAIRLYS
jgi:hypothetical protein